MKFMRFSILNVSSIVLLFTAIAVLYLNPFNEEEFGVVMLPMLLFFASIIVFVADLIVKTLIKKNTSNYWFTQILILLVVLGARYVAINLNSNHLTCA